MSMAFLGPDQLPIAAPSGNPSAASVDTDIAGSSSARPKRTASKRPLDIKALEDKFRNLQKLERENERTAKDESKLKAKQSQNHAKILNNQKKGAEKDRNRCEKELDRISKVLTKVQRESATKGERQIQTIGKIDETIERLAQEQKALEEELEIKVQAAAEAKGNLAHIEFAKSVLEKSSALPLDFLNAPIDDDLEEIDPSLLAISDKEREPALLKEAEELRSGIFKLEEDNAHLRQEIERARRLLLRKQEGRWEGDGGALQVTLDVGTMKSLTADMTTDADT